MSAPGRGGSGYDPRRDCHPQPPRSNTSRPPSGYQSSSSRPVSLASSGRPPSTSSNRSDQFELEGAATMANMTSRFSWSSEDTVASEHPAGPQDRTDDTGTPPTRYSGVFEDRLLESGPAADRYSYHSTASSDPHSRSYNRRSAGETSRAPQGGPGPGDDPSHFGYANRPAPWQSAQSTAAAGPSVPAGWTQGGYDAQGNWSAAGMTHTSSRQYYSTWTVNDVIDYNNSFAGSSNQGGQGSQGPGGYHGGGYGRRTG